MLNNFKEKCFLINVKINGNNFLCLLDIGFEVFIIILKFYNIYLFDLKFSDICFFLKFVVVNNL